MGGGQREVKSCTLVHFGFSPCATAVFLHDALHRGQSDARAFKVLGTMQALEYAEEFVGIFHVEARPVVANEDRRLAVFLSLSDLDDRRSSIARVLEGIRNQVLEDLPYE